MNNQSIKIFVSCTFSAGIGALIALELNTTLWWIGAITGGLLAYLSYEFKMVVTAFRRAFSAVFNMKHARRLINFFERVIITLIYGLLIFSYVIIANIMHKPDVDFADMNFVGLYVTATVVGAIWQMTKAVTFNSIVESLAGLYSSNPITLSLMIFASALSAIIILMYCLVLIKQTGPIVSKYSKEVCVKIALFLKTAFIYMHSDFRLLYGISGAMGASIGYFNGSAIIGAFTGGFFALFSREIVSKRFLKLNV